MIAETGDHPVLGIGHSRHPPKGPPQINPRRPYLVDEISAPPQHTPPQSDAGRLPRAFPPIIKEWGSWRLWPNPLIRWATLRMAAAQEVLPWSWFSVFFVFFFCVLQNEVFYGGRSANAASDLLKKNSNQTAGGRPQTAGHEIWIAGCSQGTPSPFDRFCFSLCSMSISIHPPHQEAWWGRRFSRRQPDRETG